MARNLAYLVPGAVYRRSIAIPLAVITKSANIAFLVLKSGLLPIPAMTAVSIFIFLAVFTPLARAIPLHSISLKEAYLAALEKSETVKQSELQVVQADERIIQVRGGILPQISIFGTHLIQPLPSDPIAQQFSPQNQTTISLSATQQIFRGFREFAGIRQRGHLKSASEANRKSTEIRLFQDVSANFLSIMSFEQDIKNLEDQADIYDRRVKELQTNVKRGESSATDVLTAQTTLTLLQAEARLIKGQLLSAREAFRFLTGLSAETLLEDPNLISRKSPIQLRKLEEYLARIDLRPDVQASSEQYQATEDEVWISRGAHLPSAEVAGNYYLARPGFLSDLNWDVQFRLSLPLFEGGTIQARVRESVALRSESELALERVRRLADQEIRSLYDRFNSRIDHLKILEKALDQTDKNARTVRQDYRRGLLRNTDVQLVLAEYRAARRSYDQTYFAAQLELLQLQAAAMLLPSFTDTPVRGSK